MRDLVDDIMLLFASKGDVRIRGHELILGECE